MQDGKDCDEYLLVRDNLGEAMEEVAELRRLLAEAESRCHLVETGQGELGWWDSFLISVARWVWGGCSSEQNTPELTEMSF